MTTPTPSAAEIERLVEWIDAGRLFGECGCATCQKYQQIAGVAQLVEQPPCKRKVAGSNPCRWHQVSPPEAPKIAPASSWRVAMSRSGMSSLRSFELHAWPIKPDEFSAHERLVHLRAKKPRDPWRQDAIGIAGDD